MPSSTLSAPCSGFTTDRGLAGTAARTAPALALARPLGAPPVSFFSRLLPPPDLGFAGRTWCCALPLV